ncbi:hypothetical protein VNI00_004488 [Paramarasmius palmivorus]|uniref:Integrase catalytic domain-containing protein n=1 Tax=Paramarasmius palmivorus TaxID=297713 RepID=A0AAW0DI33_9AGAR
MKISSLFPLHLYALLILFLFIDYAHSSQRSGADNSRQLLGDAERFMTISRAYHELGQRVRAALLTEIGDRARLEEHRRQACDLIDSVTLYRRSVPSGDFQVITSSINEMITALEGAIEQSRDGADNTEWPSVATSYLVYTGRPGRPRREINPGLLATGLELRGPSGLADTFQCSARTVNRRARDYGLVEPGAPVYVEYDDAETGQRVRLYHPHGGGQRSSSATTLSDDDLDKVIAHILKIFPMFGRRMILGHLRHLGHSVPRERVRASYERVQGMPAGMIHRRIHRRVYRVAGPNALWHHDGQHNLIRYRVVIHAFVDGYSRFVTGIRASDNNRADTVAALFHEARAVHGTPCRVRGDHGGENIEVAEFMEDSYGYERGSYIWGRSVHNVRIERLWRDITQGFGQKWKEFFKSLEATGGLQPDVGAHCWLLHHLFLSAVNDDALEWAEAWNRHTMRQREQRERSPRDMWFFGQLENGWRDMEQGQATEDPEAEDPESYGVDWEELDNRDILTHHFAHNHDHTIMEALNTQNEGNTMSETGGEQTRRPRELSYVEVPTFECPMTEEEVNMLNDHLWQLPQAGSRSMNDRRALWEQALTFCRDIIFGESQI